MISYIIIICLPLICLPLILGRCPPELLCLNPVELSLISPINVIATTSFLRKGCHYCSKPTTFAVTNDLNDVINVHGRCISTFNLQIFSRWGEKVFETSSITDSWDGTFRGQKMDTGVFVYKADGVSIDGQSFKLKGNITLIR